MKQSFNRKSLLLPLLLLAAGSAWAEWEKVSETGKANFYADKATIRKDGNLRKMWSITDYKQRDKDGEMSLRMKNEYDCKGERVRYLSISAHTESMADGKTLFNEGEDQVWREIPPETAYDSLLKIACAQ